MKRRDFLKRFGIGAAAVVAAPAILSHPPDPEIWGSITTVGDPPTGMEIIQDGTGAWEQMREENMHPHYAQYHMTHDECYISQWDELHMHEFNQEIHEELIKRYGERMGIWDFLNILNQTP